MSNSPPYTWKEQGGYRPTQLPTPFPTMLIAPAPIFMAAPAVAVAVKPGMPPPPPGLFFAFSNPCKSVAAPAKPKSDSSKSVAAPEKPRSEAAKSVVAKSEAASAKPPSQPANSVAAKSDSAKSVASKASSKASSKATCKSNSNTKPAPALPGMKYIYPKNNTCIHVIKGAKVWDGTGGNFKCKVFNVGTPMTIAEFIEHLTGKEGDACKGWVITEVIEKGDGVFDKGTSIEYGCDKAGTTLAAIGWTEACGVVRPPVWVVLHKG